MKNKFILAPFWGVPGAQDGNKNRFQNVFSAPSRSFESHEGPKGPLGPPKMSQNCHFGRLNSKTNLDGMFIFDAIFQYFSFSFQNC